MAPKDAKGKGGKGEVKPPAPSVLELTFPPWNETLAAAEKEAPGKCPDLHVCCMNTPPPQGVSR